MTLLLLASGCELSEVAQLRDVCALFRSATPLVNAGTPRGEAAVFRLATPGAELRSTSVSTMASDLLLLVLRGHWLLE